MRNVRYPPPDELSEQFWKALEEDRGPEVMDVVGGSRWNFGTRFVDDSAYLSWASFCPKRELEDGVPFVRTSPRALTSALQLG